MKREITRRAFLMGAASGLLAGCSKSLRSVAPSLKRSAGKLVEGAARHIVVGPYVVAGENDVSSALNVVWWSDAPGPGSLAWTCGGVSGASASEQMPFEGLVRHVARVERPKEAPADFAYVAAVEAGGKRYTSRQQAARFAPAPGQALRFAAVGDTGAGSASERRVVEQLMRQNVDLVVITGDDAYDHGDWDDYRARFFPYYAALMARTPMMPTLGNHDVGHPHRGGPFRAVWSPPDNGPAVAEASYVLDHARSNKMGGAVAAGEGTLRNYSFDAGRCHFIGLDSTADADTMRRLIVPWAAKDLADAKGRGQTWLIAFWHHPPYTRGAYRDNSVQWTDIRSLFVPAMRAAGVQLVLNGHDHNYQHFLKDGIHYVVTGGGGAGLHAVHADFSKDGQPPLLAHNDQVHSFTLFEQSADGRSLAVEQRDEHGAMLDRFTVTA